MTRLLRFARSRSDHGLLRWVLHSPSVRPEIRDGQGRSKPPQVVQQAFARQVEYGHGLLAGHALEAVQELLQRPAGGDAVEQVLERDPGAVETRGAADPRGVDPDQPKQGVAGLNP